LEYETGTAVASRRFILQGIAILASTQLPSVANAAWPDRSIRLIVPYSPGGGVDVTARLLAQSLTEHLGQTVFVDNRPGAGSSLGAGFVARSTPDGYTLLLATPSGAINASLYRTLPYDLRRDLVPVAGVASSELALVVGSDSPFHTLADLLAAARAQPGKLTYGSAGVGSTEHLAGELLKQMANVDVMHVPYKGTGQAIGDLLGNRVQFLFGGAAGLIPQVRAGQLRALAITSAQRPADLPDIPTMAEGGVPGYEITIWNGVLAPKGTPPAIIRRLNEAITAASLGLADRFRALGGQPMPMSPAELQGLIDAQITKWGAIINQANVHVD
jgi:tripartite-type tricarboxylate transporter receptor subunit TctC